jgi:hypothetical protein
LLSQRLLSKSLRFLCVLGVSAVTSTRLARFTARDAENAEDAQRVAFCYLPDIDWQGTLCSGISPGNLFSGGADNAWEERRALLNLRNNFNKSHLMGYTPHSSPGRFYQALSQNKTRNAQELVKISFAEERVRYLLSSNGTIPIKLWEQPLTWLFRSSGRCAPVKFEVIPVSYRFRANRSPNLV